MTIVLYNKVFHLSSAYKVLDQQKIASQKTYDDVKNSAIEIMEKIGKENVFDLDISKFKGSFYPIDVSSLSLDQKKKLIDELYNYAITNNIPMVLRITNDYLYLGRSYAREVAYFKPPVEVVQNFIDQAIEKGYLKGKELEFYANPNMGILVKVRDGKVEKIVTVSSSNVETSFKSGVYTLDKLEKGGWGIPSNLKDTIYSSFISKYPDSFNKYGNPHPWSMFNLMGSGKIPFEDLNKLHFRALIYPGTLHELPLGGEAGIKDDRYDQTTRGCLYIGEGSFKILKTKDGKIVTGQDTEIRKKDIGILIKKGDIIAEDLELGTTVKMRNGKIATLSLDKYGNQVWLDEDGIYVPFNSYNFDFNEPGMPQIVFMPPEFGKSEIISKEAEGKRLYIDNKLYYTTKVKNEAGDESLSVFIFPDRYGMLTDQEKRKIKNEILNNIKQEGGVLDKKQIEGLDILIRYAQIVPVNLTNININ